MFNPVSTYRIQFHKGFTFHHLERMLPYLQKLGVKTIYASPIFEATPGSTHGYDGLNPHRINPEIGTEEELYGLSKKLAEAGITWLQDIVPNHMAFDPRNPWLMDVLEKGRHSVYAPYFDVAWNSSLFQGHIMVPFLGSPLEDVIKNGELKLEYKDQRLVLKYYDSMYPLRLRSYETVLRLHEAEANAAVKGLLKQVQDIQRRETAEAYNEGFDEWRLQFASLMKNEPTRAFVEGILNEINNNPKQLQALACEQVYRLCHWQETDSRINYRRFFTVNGLICLNIQEPQVFDHYHEFIERLLKAGVFQGLRIDHIDGLYDPGNYLERLRELAGEEPYVVVEKILEQEESLPLQWPVQGTSGYEFLALVNNLFTNRQAKQPFTQFYYGLTGDYRTVPQQVRDSKERILYQHMAGELDNLYHLFAESNLVEPARLLALPEGVLKKAIGAFLVHCPVYRFYGNKLPLEETESRAVQAILDAVRQTETDLAEAATVLEEVFLKSPHAGDADYNSRALHVYQRFMQFSGPLMAKGVEDTVMYTFNRFIGHNEVGDDPGAFGIPVQEFHQKMQARQQDWPLSLNATSTHDTKRGEDTRARLNVLTDLPGVWLETVEQWRKLNSDLKQNGAPDANDEYFIYQALAGSYPVQGAHDETYTNRLQEYLQKALREAKRHSNWTTPNVAYEQAAKDFAVKLLDTNRPFWKRFQKHHQKIAPCGIINSLAQVVLKFTCPGVPDVYQGCELWDYSFVDPDNRRAVDYEELKKLLDGLSAEADEKALRRLWEHGEDARIKLALVHRLLKLRSEQCDVFTYGDYLPLQVEGACKDNVLAFARKYRQVWCVVVVPLHLAVLVQAQKKKGTQPEWKDTVVVLPNEVKESWENVLTGSRGKKGKGLLVRDLFKAIPFAVLKMQGTDNARRAGILLHLTSLSSAFGIGDLGPEAKRFADFLHRAKQRYWQLLPINPTEGGQGHSPYSSTSSRAGNVLLLSPELLVRDGVLTKEILRQYELPVEAKTDYEMAERVKGELFNKAWLAFQEGKGPSLQKGFDAFKEQERPWLYDFAVFTALKQQHKGKPWYEWPERYKLREPGALEQFAAENAGEMEKVQWLQYLFAKQWTALKTYCNAKNIQLLGDLPIYVSYDSVDVWANKPLFKLDADGARIGVAGVPPDAFSDDGQLWGMPVYDWPALKKRNYDWWVDRLRKNSELFDVIRLDHFRAFADYWEVPASETTAKNGEWKPGPGAHFFTSIKQQLGDLPFIAEDLGEINEAVLQLRDEFGLPGMKILQFAFGGDVASSDYIPHNYTQNFVAYTGTHDNNTTRGWFRQEVNAEMQHRIQHYLARPVSEKDITYFFCRLAHASVAKTVILPMQDVLGLDEKARMNTPASGKNNWGWRLLPGQLTKEAEQQLSGWTSLYNRG
jgi:malto-oligosyltrehalose synthase/4-alpha-glucanotransferase